jgi:hypothetical protein
VSRSVDVFINSPLELDQLAGRLGELAGASVTSAPDGHRFEWNDGQVVASLGTHQYVDDGNLRLSRFPYVLSSRVGTSNLLASPELAMARQVADLVRLRLGSSVLVVQDLERRDAGEPAGETAS